MALTGKLHLHAAAGAFLLGSLAVAQSPVNAASNDIQATSLVTGSTIAYQPVRGCPADGGCRGLPFGQVAALGKNALIFARDAAWKCIGGVTDWVSSDRETGS